MSAQTRTRTIHVTETGDDGPFDVTMTLQYNGAGVGVGVVTQITIASPDGLPTSYLLGLAQPLMGPAPSVFALPEGGGEYPDPAPDTTPVTGVVEAVPAWTGGRPDTQTYAEHFRRLGGDAGALAEYFGLKNANVVYQLKRDARKAGDLPPAGKAKPARPARPRR